jgi:myosin heavy subunit
MSSLGDIQKNIGKESDEKTYIVVGNKILNDSNQSDLQSQQSQQSQQNQQNQQSQQIPQNNQEQKLSTLDKEITNDYLEGLKQTLEKYKSIEKIINQKTDLADKIEKEKGNNSEVLELKKEISELKQLLSSLISEKFQSKKESENMVTQQQNIQQKIQDVQRESKTSNADEVYLKQIEELKKEIESLKSPGKKTGENEEYFQKLKELESFKEKVMKDRIESLYLKRLDLIDRYGLNALEQFIPDPLKNPDISEKDLYVAIENLLKNDVIRSGIDVLKKNEVVKSKDEAVPDLKSLDKKQLAELKNKLLRRQT